MASYQLKIKKSAEKELAHLPVDIIIAIRDRIISLKNNPFPQGYKKLKGFRNLYRIRSGNYHLFYRI